MDYSTLGTAPISTQEPAGTDVKYDDDFERVEAELSKLSSPADSAALDWALVAKLSENILEHKSKNLLIAVYLTYALLKLRGIVGMADGVKVLADMLENYWETLYPPLKRIKGRINAIEWLLEKVSKELESTQSIEVDSSKKDDLMADLKRIDDFLNTKLDEPPLLYNLVKLVDAKLVSEAMAPVEETASSQQESTTQTTEEQTSTSEQTANNQAFDPQETVPKERTVHHPANDDDTQNAFKHLVNDLSILTGEMLEAEDYRSELFMINRAFAWLDIESTPSSQKQITMLPPPDTQEIELLQKLYDTHDYSALLWAAESRITTYLFWLDLHYYVAESLQQLGFSQAAGVVLQQTRYFVEKLPNLQELTFSDKTPFARKQTKKWLMSQQRAENVDVIPIPASTQEEVSCDAQGIDRLAYLMAHSESVEQEVLYNITLCQCLSTTATNKVLVMTYASHLLERVQKYATQKWNPTLAKEAYVAALACYKSLDEEPTAEITALYEKIALFQPSLVKEL